MAIEHAAYARGLSKETGTKKAAGFFISPGKYHTRQGKLIGFTADNTVAAFLGVLGSYLFSFSGKDNYILKGLATGNFSWSSMYGVMSRFGATKASSNDPNTTLTFMISHAAFGITKSYILTKITDPGLFKPHFEPLGLPERNATTAESSGERLHSGDPLHHLQ
jgi:hypothetical protein